MRRVLPAVVAVGAALAGVAAHAGDAAPKPRIAIIIDDIGYRLEEGRRAVALPSAVAIAVLPHATHSVQLARAAHTSGKEVLLHLPMQALGGAENPGPGALTSTDTRLDAAAVFAADLSAVPFARGVNNHMGSLLTRERGSAVAIGHPHSATLDVLERELPALDAQGVQLVTLTALLMTTMAQ